MKTTKHESPGTALRHREAIEVLADYGLGALEPGIEDRLRRHVDECRACREWLETRDLLAAGSESPSESADDHPTSDLLALCAIRPEEIHETDRRELREHLDACPTCRDDLDTVRRALEAARPSSTPPAGVPARPHAAAKDAAEDAATPAAGFPLLADLSRGSRLPAAAFVALLLAGALVVLPFISDVFAPSDPDLLPAAERQIAQADIPAGNLSGTDLEGRRLIAGDRLVVSHVTVRPEADVTFQAEHGVAFGDGFQVASGARLRVDSGKGKRPAGDE